MAGIKLKELLSRQIRAVYRLVVLDDDSLQEIASFRLSPLNLYIALSTTLVAVIVLIFSLVVYTPLKEYIPGYADPSLRRQLRQLSLNLDSAELALMQNSSYLDNILQVTSGKMNKPIDTLKNVNPNLYDAELLELSKGNDSLLKKMVVEMSSTESNSTRTIQGGFTWPMRKARIIQKFQQSPVFHGIGLKSESDSLVFAIQSGYVVYSGYLLGYGETLLIQSSDGSLLGYGHLGVCLKKTGSFVRSTEVIGYANQKRIQFSLWINGNPVDPTPLFQNY